MKISKFFLFAIVLQLLVSCGENNLDNKTTQTKNKEGSKHTELTCDEKLEEYKILISNKDYWAASTKMSGCSIRYPEKYKSYATEAEIKGYESIFTDKNKSSADRLKSFREFEKIYPQKALEYTNLLNNLQMQVEKDNSEELKKIAKKKKSEGVSIGMTKEDVLASSWGKPIRINTTTNKWGVSEQWVYGGGNYLYFQNGILESIRN